MATANKATLAGRDANRQRKLEDIRNIQLAQHRALIRQFGKDIMALVDRAWAAGLFDGEGHVSARSAPGQFDCSIEQVEDDVVNLERFRSIVGVGAISRARERGGKRRPTCTWKVTNQHDLRKVWEAIGPFLNPAKRNGKVGGLDGFARALAVPAVTLLNNEKPLDGFLSAEVERTQTGKRAAR